VREFSWDLVRTLPAPGCNALVVSGVAVITVISERASATNLIARMTVSRLTSIVRVPVLGFFGSRKSMTGDARRL
jgi:hypothetical protein